MQGAVVLVSTDDGIKALGNSYVLQTASCKDLVKRLKTGKGTKLTGPGQPLFLRQLTLCSPCLQARNRSGRSDECAFKYLRAVSTGEMKIYYGHFIEPTILKFPQVYATPLTKEEREVLSRGTASSLEPSLVAELNHVQKYRNQIMFRNRDLQVREVCDVCRMSLFGASWLCLRCGKDICVQCLESLDAKNPLPFIDSCSSGANLHSRGHFIPCSRFTEQHLLQTLETIGSLLSGPGYSLSVQTFCSKLVEVTESERLSRILRVPQGRLRASEFWYFLSRRTPLVITGLSNRLQLAWSPAQLAEEFGDQYCTMEDCEGQAEPQRTTLKGFLGYFTNQRNHGIWKVKDWPPDSKLAESHPDLCRDFTSALPVPEYTRRDGPLNLAAHFPTNCALQPDLGPKVYMALASIQDDEHSGSTRLHCDLCDAINIMVYSTPANGTALWHIFKAVDANKIRLFLRNVFQCNPGDPIHTQQYYLGPSLLAQLESDYQVVPFVIHQAVGEAVFIPAGCPHQVSNEAHCIKVATDFLSLEALSACEDLAKEFRAENLRDAWKDDVLQLNAQVFYAWTSLQRPLEAARVDFRDSDLGTVHSEIALPGLSGQTCHGRKRKYRGDDDGAPQRPGRKFRCDKCPPSAKLFFHHGLQAHMSNKHGTRADSDMNKYIES